MPGVPSCVIEPIWDQFRALLPERVVTHPLGCHRPRIADRIVFDKLVQILVLGAAYERIADSTCSATTLRDRRDEWIEADLFTQLAQLCLEAYDRIVGLDLAEAGAVASVGTVGDSYDNAMAEALNSIFKAELVRNKGPWYGIDDLEIATAEYIDWYNHRRLHGELNLVPPVEHEANNHHTTAPVSLTSG